MRKLREIFERNNMSKNRIIYRVINDFEETGTVGDTPQNLQQCTASLTQNITAAQENIQNKSTT